MFQLLQIVDLALIVKQDQEVTDPVLAAMPPSINPESNIVKILNISRNKTTSGSTTATPVHTPPSDAPTTTQLPSSSGTTTTTTNTGSNFIAPVQGGLASSLGTASLASSGLIKPSKAKKKKTKVV